jgi:CHAD domain-containing protein
MARSSQPVHPMQNLRDLTTSLEASILVCLAKPRKKAVHQLRTSTRRIEAQLELLSMLPELPPHEPQRKKALRLLKKLRRAAGKVRDLDVQGDLIRSEAAGNKSASRPDPKLREEARQLRSELNHQRGDQADRLEKLLHKQRSKLPLVFEALLDALQPAESIKLTEAKLTALVQNWYAQPSDAAAQADPHADDIEQLHAIRKRAKIARYLAESAPESAVAARRLAAQFENLQQAGGEWHDWLLLADIAARELGKSAQLPARFNAHADRSLRAYKRRLGHTI